MNHHKDLPPSAAPALQKCPCYKSGPAGPAAARGTAMHAAMEEHFRSDRDLDRKKWGLGDEDCEELLWAIEYIRKRMEWREMRIEHPVLVFGPEGDVISFGTADVYGSMEIT